MRSRQIRSKLSVTLRKTLEEVRNPLDKVGHIRERFLPLALTGVNGEKIRLGTGLYQESPMPPKFYGMSDL